MSSFKVTFCAYDKPDNVGGPPAWMQRLLPFLCTQGIEVRCLFLLHYGETGPTIEHLKNEGIPCRSILAQDSTEERLRWILGCLREEPPDLFIPNLVVAAYWATRWLKKAGIPCVGILHSDDPFYHAIHERFVAGMPCDRVNSLVVVSKALEQKVSQSRTQSLWIERIPYGVPIPPANPRNGSQNLRLCYVGRFSEEQKRISEVTRAMCRAAREIPGCEAVLYGDGPDRANVEAILSQEALGNRVRNGGLIDSNRIQDELKRFDVIVLLSDYEGLPIALMEAMACGCVPICTQMQSGIPELIEHGMNGILVEDRGDAFVAAVRMLAEDQALLKKMGISARERIAGSDLSSEACGIQWLELLKRLQASGGPKQPIRIPKKFKLGPVHPDLASADIRQVILPCWLRGYRRFRILLGRWRRRLLEVPTE